MLDVRKQALFRICACAREPQAAVMVAPEMSVCCREEHTEAVSHSFVALHTSNVEPSCYPLVIL